MIRFFLINVFLGVETILCCVLSFPVAVFDRSGILIHRYVAKIWAKVFLWVCGVKLEVIGMANIDNNIPRIYMSNHQSYFDIFAVLAGLPVDFKFIMKRELMNIPLLGFIMRRAGYIGIDRGDPRKAIESMNRAASKIQQGTSVLIFPEGTRSVDGRLQALKKGGFHLALKSNVDIVPLSISKSRDIVPKGSLKVHRGTITMTIGSPIPIKKYSRKDLNVLIESTRKAIAEPLEEEIKK